MFLYFFLSFYFILFFFVYVIEDFEILRNGLCQIRENLTVVTGHRVKFRIYTKVLKLC